MPGWIWPTGHSLSICELEQLCLCTICILLFTLSHGSDKIKNAFIFYNYGLLSNNIGLNCMGPPIHLFFSINTLSPLALPTHGFHFCRFNQLQMENCISAFPTVVSQPQIKNTVFHLWLFELRMQSPDCRLKSYMQIFDCARLGASNFCDVQQLNTLPKKLLYATFSLSVFPENSN